MKAQGFEVAVRPTRPEDFDAIIALTRRVYPMISPWSKEQLASHLEVFPEGQFVAVDSSERLLGMASSLILRWDDYDFDENWRDFTDHGMFTNHDPEGRTLYGAEIMVDPKARSLGIGSKIYRHRRELVHRLGLLRIRAGARLRGYHRYAATMSPTEYVIRVIREELGDPTLTFQIKHGFHVLSVVRGYLKKDPKSLGCAAVIEWINRRAAGPGDRVAIDSDFERELAEFYRRHPELEAEEV